MGSTRRSQDSEASRNTFITLIRKEDIMSYGVWKKRGKGWATLEIDSPWNCTMQDLERYNARTYKTVKTLARKHIDSDIYNWGIDEENPTTLRFIANQRKNGRSVIEWDVGGGEHTTWFAFDDLDSLQNAMVKNYMKPMSEDWINLLAYAQRKTGRQI